jgi:chromosomal replication initiation ATPase DnaA
MFSLRHLIVTHLNHSVNELEGKLIRIDMHHDTMQKYRYIMIHFCVSILNPR